MRKAALTLRWKRGEAGGSLLSSWQAVYSCTKILSTSIRRVVKAPPLCLRLGRNPVFTYAADTMRQQSFLLLSAAAAGSIASSEVSRPRGVGPECPQVFSLFQHCKLTDSLSLQSQNTTKTPQSSPASVIPPSNSPPPKSTTITATARMAPTSPEHQLALISHPFHPTPKVIVLLAQT